MEGLVPEEIAADAVTRDLPTTNNDLSFWACQSVDDAELRETVLALAANCERLDKMDVAWLERDAVQGEELTVLQSPEHANTPVESLKNRHVDIARLDLVRLGKVAGLMRVAVKEKRCKRFLKKEVLTVLVEAVRSGRVKAEALKERVRQDVEEALQNTVQGGS